jgi:hypothetical protein
MGSRSLWIRLAFIGLAGCGGGGGGDGEADASVAGSDAGSPEARGYFVWVKGEVKNNASRQVYRMTLPDKSDVRRLTSGEDVQAAVSRDGKWVAYAKSGLEGGTDFHDFQYWSIYLVSIEGIDHGSREIELASPGYWPSWGLGNTVYYSTADGSHTKVMKVTFDDAGTPNPPELVASTRALFASMTNIDECSMAPDGTWFAGRTRSDAMPGVNGFAIGPPNVVHIGHSAIAQGCQPHVAPSGTWGYHSGEYQGIRWGDGPGVASNRKENQTLIEPKPGGMCYFPAVSSDEKFFITGHSTDIDQNAGAWDLYLYALSKDRKTSNEQLLVSGGHNAWPNLWIRESASQAPVSGLRAEASSGAAGALEPALGCSASGEGAASGIGFLLAGGSSLAPLARRRRPGRASQPNPSKVTRCRNHSDGAACGAPAGAARQGRTILPCSSGQQIPAGFSRLCKRSRVPSGPGGRTRHASALLLGLGLLALGACKAPDDSGSQDSGSQDSSSPDAAETPPSWSAPGHVKVAQMEIPSSFAGDIAIEGNYAYVAAYQGGVAIVDISDPAHPKLVAQVDTSTNAAATSSTKNGGQARGVAVHKGFLYVADGIRGLAVVSISGNFSPTAPGNCAADPPTATTGCVFVETRGQGFGVAATSDLALVADGRNGADLSKVSGLALVGLSAPGAPSGAASYWENVGAPNSVALQGSWAFLGLLAGVSAVDISNPSAAAAPHPFPNWNNYSDGIAVADNHCYVASDLMGLAIFDVRDPTHASLAAKVPTSMAKDVAVADGMAYVADDVMGLALIDVADPAHPRGPDYRAVTDQAVAVAVSNGHVFVADGGKGLAVFRIAP